MTDDDKQQPQQPDPGAWPERFLPAGGLRSDSHIQSDEQLRRIVHRIAHTDESINDICRAEGLEPQTYYNGLSFYPELGRAHYLASRMRLERREHEILEIADEPLPQDKEAAQTEIAHRRLRMDARKHLTTKSRQALAEREGKGMDRLTLNVNQGQDSAGQQQPASVSIQVVTYQPDHATPAPIEGNATLDDGARTPETTTAHEDDCPDSGPREQDS